MKTYFTRGAAPRSVVSYSAAPDSVASRPAVAAPNQPAARRRAWMLGFGGGALLMALVPMRRAFALSWGDISNQDAVAGLKSALNSSTVKAVEKLAIDGGYWNNAKVKIPLPGYLEDARSVLNAIGMRKQLDELHQTINRSAETAVGEAKPIFVNAIKSMSVQDAKGIISGGQDSGTQYFKGKTTDQLRTRFLPVVKKATEKLGLAQKYNELAAKGASLGVIKGDSKSVETFVTQKALDGLYLMMADEEKAIRADPVGRGTDIVKKVFGAFGK